MGGEFRRERGVYPTAASVRSAERKRIVELRRGVGNERGAKLADGLAQLPGSCQGETVLNISSLYTRARTTAERPRLSFATKLTVGVACSQPANMLHSDSLGLRQDATLACKHASDSWRWPVYGR